MELAREGRCEAGVFPLQAVFDRVGSATLAGNFSGFLAYLSGPAAICLFDCRKMSYGYPWKFIDCIGIPSAQMHFLSWLGIPRKKRLEESVEVEDVVCSSSRHLTRIEMQCHVGRRVDLNTPSGRASLASALDDVMEMGQLV